MYLVLIETSGNQNYIFSTNKLKENVGASDLTYLAGTHWVLDAVHQVGGSALNSLWRTNDELRQKLLDRKLNPPIAPGNSVKVEVILAASGKAMLLTQDRDTAKRLIQLVTHRALREAPGLDICGVISKEFDWEADDLGQINRQMHQQFEVVRSSRPSPSLRFLRLPIVADCATSGFPAAEVDFCTQPPALRSKASVVKRQKKQNSDGRIGNLLREETFDFAKSIDLLDSEVEGENEKPRWLSVIHADGNGLGEIFLNFSQYIQTLELTDENPNRNYINYLRKFSLALDVCTENAFLTALKVIPVQDNNILPLVPLVLGGDDLTVICDGQSALQFTRQFLIEFEDQTSLRDEAHYDGVIPKIAQAALKTDRLSACAGVAIIKPHFPFSLSYELAEALTKSAKQVKEIVTNSDGRPYPCSALDFHILYDSSGVDLAQIRQKLIRDQQQTKLYARPYVVTLEAKLPESEARNLAWVKLHRWEDFERRVQALASQDEEGRRRLPNSQMHDLRSGLMLGKELADARYRLIRDRYLDQQIALLDGDAGSLFVKETVGGSTTYITGFWDAIDAVDFLVNLSAEETDSEISSTVTAEGA
jgi:hypothetical protein